MKERLREERKEGKKERRLRVRREAWKKMGTGKNTPECSKTWGKRVGKVVVEGWGITRLQIQARAKPQSTETCSLACVQGWGRASRWE